ncbi:MAG: OFA family MFS transporter [Clostridiales bacterium]|nr:OFA family MFS transporter [Clostridiales bacterium]
MIREKKGIYMSNKYVVVVGALVAQITIAGLYAWSIFGTAIQSERGWGENEILLTYSLAQFVFAFSTIFSGRLVDRKGPRLTLLIGGLLYGGGLILSSLATTPLMLYLTYGVLTGAGVGFVYVCPLSTLIKWFPEKKGMITGLSVGVFGGGSIVFKEVISNFIKSSNISGAFLGLGVLSLILITIGAIFTNNPRSIDKKTAKKNPEDYMTVEMIKTSQFKKIWLMYWFAVIPGLMILGAAKNIGIEVAGLEGAAAAGIISVLAISNAGSRLVSGALSDKFGILKLLKILFAITIASLLTLSFLGDIKAAFYLGIVGIALGYGGFLALFPTYTNQEFGSYRFGSNYGVIYQAYGLAALSGILIKTMAGSFTDTFIIAAIASAIGLAISFMLKEKVPDNKKSV